MKYLLASLSIALATSSLSAAPADPATAATAAKRAEPSARQMELASQFVALTFSADEYMGSLRGSAEDMAASISAALGDEGENPTLNAKLQRLLGDIEPKVRVHLPKLAQAYARVYARAYSEAELQQLIDFAQTTAGKRYLADDDSFDTDPEIMAIEERLGEDTLPIFDGLRKEACMEMAKQRLAAGDTKARCPLSAEAETLSG